MSFVFFLIFLLEKEETAYLTLDLLASAESSSALSLEAFLARTFLAELTAFLLRMPPLMAPNLSDLRAPAGPLRRLEPTLRLP